MLRDLHFETTDAGAGRRLDAFLSARCPASTPALVRRAIERGEVGVDGTACRAKGRKLAAGQRVSVARLLEAADICVAPEPSLALALVYDDADLLAANKPAGQAVHPLDPDETGTLANALVARFPELAGVGDQPLLACIVHRIDTDTSGLVLAARSAASHAAMRRQFAGREVRKTYLALATGAVARAAELAHDLVHQPWRRGRMVAARHAPGAKRPMRAVTAFRPLRRVGPDTLLEVAILTGVTHQIRCQLALAGHPLVGDTLYGAPPVPGFDRHFLHASAIDLRHPSTGAPLHIEAPPTADLVEFLERRGVTL